MTYAHDSHCNVIHTPGPQECPPAQGDAMTEDLVHVHLNEGRCQVFEPMDNGHPEWYTHPVPRPTWETYAEAVRRVDEAEANLTAALETLLEAIKATVPEGDNVRQYVVDGDRYYWP